ncbi:MAG: hypothetical protein LBI99_02035 [Propionibacteriaceae bacterium]|nr:hypothetical protein [Propionibacteriaceae bacterium]
MLTHFDPLRDALDKVVGNPAGVEVKAQRWDSVASSLNCAADVFLTSTNKEVSLWTGESGANAAEFTKTFGKFVKEAAARCNDAASAMRFASNLVEAVREIITDIISDLVGQAISWVAQVGLTLGVGATWVVPKAIRKVAEWLAKVKKWFTKLTKAMRKIAEKIKRLNTIFQTVGKRSSKLGSLLLGLVKNAGGRPHKLPKALVRAAKSGPSLRWLVEALPNWSNLAGAVYTGAGGEYKYY